MATAQTSSAFLPLVDKTLLKTGIPEFMIVKLR